MPCWYFEKEELKNTPSIQDGIDYETECRYRKEGARFIIDTGSKMDLGYNTMATGVVYFHRFYMFHSFKQFPRYVTACCCLCLAGKVEETPKKCRDIINTAKTLLTKQKFMTFGEDPKEEVMTLERILLQTIKFDLQVEHPYSYLIKYAKCLKGDKGKLQKMVQMAWTFVNDSLCTTLSLQWEPEIIAIALMYLASKLSKFEVVDWIGRQPKHLRWWDMFVEDLTMDLLEDICHQVLDLYSSQSDNSKPPDSPPIMATNTPNRDSVAPPPPPPLPPAPPSESTPTTPNGRTGIFSSINTDGEPHKLNMPFIFLASKPSKIPKLDVTPGPSNGCPPVDPPVEGAKPLEIPPPHYPPYSTNFPTAAPYPPVFPPANISVPPPPVNTMNHMVPPMRLGPTPPPIRPTPPHPAPGPPFPPYGYPTNAYFPSGTPAPPPPTPPPPPRPPYYPPQPQ